MSYLNLPELQDLEGEARELMEDTKERWGFVPNISRAYALAPEVMAAEDTWSKGVMYKGFLPRTLKEAIATVVSSTNECDYCKTSHALAYTLAGGKEEEAISCATLDLTSFSESERNVLSFAQKATANAKSISQEDIDSLKQHYSNGEIVEIAAVIQQFMGYNWFVTILGLKLDQHNPMAVQ